MSHLPSPFPTEYLDFGGERLSVYTVCIVDLEGPSMQVRSMTYDKKSLSLCLLVIHLHSANLCMGSTSERALKPFSSDGRSRIWSCRLKKLKAFPKLMLYDKMEVF